MIPDKNTNTARIPSNFETVGFGIDNDDFSHIVDILQNQLYSDKPLALVREYSCNAYDANVAAGRKNTPIRISLPSKFTPHLKIRDFGNGLSADDMKLIFTRYGKSTKRNDNTTVGCFGIGSKCGFAYTPNFLVNSFQNGIKSAYSCVLTETKAGDLVSLGKSATTEADGVEIIINIKQDDINTFRDICMKFFKYWDVMPEIEGFTADDYKKIKGNNEVILSGNGWKILKVEDTWNRRTSTTAVMGNIGYPINWNSVKGLQEMMRKFANGNDPYNLNYFITDNNIVLDFGIGDIKMSPSRESLQYTDLTNAALVNRVKLMLEEVAHQAQIKMNSAQNLWNAKKMYEELLGNYGGLHRLRGTIKLNYNGKVIESSSIRGFDKYGIDKEAILKSYHRRNANTNHYCYPCGLHSWNHIDCGDKRVILEIDQEKGVYIQKAVKHLSDKGYATVYVLQFKDEVQRATVFAELGLEDSFITKYSSIADAVKNTITRNAATGVPRVNKETTIRSVRSFDSNTFSSYRYSSVRDLTTEDIDLSAGGIYIETYDNKLVEGGFIPHICETICNLGKYKNSVVKVYFVGQNLVNGKLMKQGNWVKFNDYVKAEVDNIIKNDKQLSIVAAFDKVRNHDGVFVLSNRMVNLLNTTKISKELAEIVSFHMDKKAVAKAIVNTNLKVSDADMEYVKGLFATVAKQYPLLNVLNSAVGYSDVESQLPVVVEYIKNQTLTNV